MPYTEAQLATHISSILMDEGTSIWSTAQIHAQLQQDLRVISHYRPQLVYGTVTFASTAKVLVATAFTTMVGDPVALEYETGKDPIRYRNFEYRNGTIIPDIDFTPTSGASAFVWYNAPHTVSSANTVNTLDPEEERILIQLVAANLMISKSIDLVNTFPRGGPRSIVDFREHGKEKKVEALQDLRAISDSHHLIVQDWPKVRS